MRKILLLCFLISFSCQKGFSLEDFLDPFFVHDVVVSTKKIELEGFPGAFNPSIIKIDEGFLLTFRYVPDREYCSFISFIGVVLLNENFEQISSPQLLNTRPMNSKVPNQAEDARIFSYRGRMFLIYNDNHETVWYYGLRRYMYIAELFLQNGEFNLSTPMRLRYEAKHDQHITQKNWVPFEWDNSLLFTYSLYPHEILYPNLYDGKCYYCYETASPMPWEYGTLRGSTPPVLVDGEYLAFFHSGIPLASEASWDLPCWHYFMGAYTFSAKPPFEITKMTPSPIIAKGFYVPSESEKRVIFPGGTVVSGSNIYVAYGKDDCEVWIATLDKSALMRALVSCRKE